MQGGTKADNSFPVNIQKAALCFRIIWQGSLIDAYAINHNTTAINHDTGIQIQHAKSKFWKPNPLLLVLKSRSKHSNPNVKIPIPKSNSMNPPSKFWDPNPVAHIRKSNSNFGIYIPKSKTGVSNQELQIPTLNPRTLEFKPCSPNPNYDVHDLDSTSITPNPICGIQILKSKSGGGSKSKVWNQVPKSKYGNPNPNYCDPRCIAEIKFVKSSSWHTFPNSGTPSKKSNFWNLVEMAGCRAISPSLLHCSASSTQRCMQTCSSAACHGMVRTSDSSLPKFSLPSH